MRPVLAARDARRFSTSDGNRMARIIISPYDIHVYQLPYFVKWVSRKKSVFGNYLAQVFYQKKLTRHWLIHLVLSG